MSSTRSSLPRNNRMRRRRSSVHKAKQSPKLFDYFVVVGVEHTNFNAATDKEFAPNTKEDMGWTPVVQYSYNANKLLSTSSTSTNTTSSSSSSNATTETSPRRSQYSKLHLDSEKEKEELELMEQIRKFTFCDLSDLVNKYNALSSKDKEARKYYKMLSFKHGLQSEKFTFCVTKSNGRRLYGHCVRLFSPDVNLKSSEMPTALVLISSHAFHSLFDQIMEHIVVRWFICHQAIFPILDALILQSPPALGDTFSVTIKSQVTRQDEVLTFKLNSTYHQSLKKLFQTLSVDNILWLISCILTERRIIFYCNSLETLSECIHALIALIYPFRWQHIFVPVLPESLINYLAAPMPFIIGIKSYLAHSKTEFGISEVVLVDLDSQSVRSTDELKHKLRPLPSDPSWKLKRELKKNKKKFALFLQTHDEYRSKYLNYNMQKTSISIPKFQANMDDVAVGWDDVAFYDAFLAFFVLLIGDWRNFYDESNKNVPKPPYHLSSERASSSQQNLQDGDEDGNNAEGSAGSLRQSTTAASHTPPLEDSVGDNNHNVDVDNGKTGDAVQEGAASPNTNSNSQRAANVKKNIFKLAGQAKKFGGIASDKIKKKLQDEKKKREVHKDKKMYYNAEALEYIEMLCQSQMFQTWFVRQQKEANDSMRKVSGVQDRYDYVMANFNRIGASYTGCYKYLCQDSKDRLRNQQVHGNLKQLVELTVHFTSSTSYQALMQQHKSIEMSLNKLANEAMTPMSCEAIKNILLFRLNDCFGKNNHPHGLMALYLLWKLIENSSDRILMEAMNNYVFYANVLTKYQHEKMQVTQHMNQAASKIVKLATHLDELKKKKIDKYVAFGDDYEYKYDEKKTRDATSSNAKSDDNDNNKKGKRAMFIDDKIAQIDFANIANNKQDQSLLGNLLYSNNFDADNMFTEVSQFRVDDIQTYRKRCVRGEVRMIPPFEHLRNEFGRGMPENVRTVDEEDVFAFFSDGEDEMDDDELKANQEMMMSDGYGSQRASDRASNFAMNVLSSVSPTLTAIQSNRQLTIENNAQPLSIFDLANQMQTPLPTAASADDFQSENDASIPPSPRSDFDTSGFLSRTDTRRDNHQQTMREMNQEWVNFDDDGNGDQLQADNGDNPFRSSLFSKSADNGFDSLFASNNNNAPTSSAPSIVKQASNDVDYASSSSSKMHKVKTGIGSVLGKAKQKAISAAQAVKRRSSIGDAFGIDDVTPFHQQLFSSSSATTSRKNSNATTTKSKALPETGQAQYSSADFDPLNFSTNTAPKQNNIHQAEHNNAKAASLFADFFDDEANNTNNNTKNSSNGNNGTYQPPQPQPQTQQKAASTASKYVPGHKAQDTFGDLFGDFSTPKTQPVQQQQQPPQNANGMQLNDDMAGFLGPAQPSTTTNNNNNNNHKASVQDAMKGAYNTKSFNQTQVPVKKKVQAKNPDLFDDLLFQ